MLGSKQSIVKHREDTRKYTGISKNVFMCTKLKAYRNIKDTKKIYLFQNTKAKKFKFTDVQFNVYKCNFMSTSQLQLNS